MAPPTQPPFGPTTTRICILGLGYIGLPTAAVLASRGYTIHGVEIDDRAATTINAGKAHIVEPELDILVRAAVETGKLRAHREPTSADIYMLCVPTPLTEAHRPDLSFVRAAAESLGPHLQPGNLVILESTSPPGTTEMVAELIHRDSQLKRGQLHFAHAPERVLPGRILREVVENDRIIGGLDEASTAACAAFYSTFVSGELHLTSARMAETVKLVENASRDVNIAFANELSLLADTLELDVWELIRLANRHPRVHILNPGPGVGGHCIAVDPWFLVDSDPVSTRLIRTAREVNDHKPSWVIERVKRRAERLKRPRIACLGLAYKPDIDDLRESPALEIVRQVAQLDEAEVRVVEPNLQSHSEFTLVPLDEALRDADIVLALVAHREFSRIPAAQLAERAVIDACGVFQRPAG